MEAGTKVLATVAYAAFFVMHYGPSPRRTASGAVPGCAAAAKRVRTTRRGGMTHIGISLILDFGIFIYTHNQNTRTYLYPHSTHP